MHWEINTNVDNKKWANKLNIGKWRSLAKKYISREGFVLKDKEVTQDFTTREEWGILVMNYLVTEAIQSRISPQNISVIIENTASRYETIYRDKALGIIRTDNIQSTLYTQAEEFSRLARMFKHSTRTYQFLIQKQLEINAIIMHLQNLGGDISKSSLEYYVQVARNNQRLIHSSLQQIKQIQLKLYKRLKLREIEAKEEKERDIERLAVEADTHVAQQQILPSIENLALDVRVERENVEKREQSRQINTIKRRIAPWNKI